MIEINGKQYPLWSQFVEHKNEWIGGTLHDKDMYFGKVSPETEIVDIDLRPNGKDSAFFEIVGKDYGCGFDVKVGGISGNQRGDGTIMLEGYGGHRFSIRKGQSNE